MKGKRRHELEQNELADRLAKLIEGIKPYQNAILGGILLSVIVFGGIMWSRSRSAGAREKGWHKFNVALSRGEPDAAVFETISKDYSDAVLSCRAALMAADLRLGTGCDLRFTDKASADDELKEAVNGYMKVRPKIREEIGDDVDQRALWEQATFGLARARETLGELDKAIKLYGALTKNADGVYYSAAKRRMADLRDQATQDLYDRLAQYRPKPSSPGSFNPFADPPDFESDNLDPNQPFPRFGPVMGQGDDDDDTGGPGDALLGAPLADPPKLPDPGGDAPKAEPPRVDDPPPIDAPTAKPEDGGPAKPEGGDAAETPSPSE